jgi:hypothetical protein
MNYVIYRKSAARGANCSRHAMGTAPSTSSQGAMRRSNSGRHTLTLCPSSKQRHVRDGRTDSTTRNKHSRPPNPSISRLAQNQFNFGPSAPIGLVLGWTVITRPDLIARRQGLASRPSGKPWRGRVSITISDYRQQYCGRRLTAPADVESPAGKPGDSICRYWLCDLSPRGTVDKTRLRAAKAGKNACGDGASSCVGRNLFITGHARKSPASRVSK